MPPSKLGADLEAENTRRMLAMRQSASASVKTTQLGAPDYGKNTQTAALTGAPSSPTSATLGTG